MYYVYETIPAKNRRNALAAGVSTKSSAARAPPQKICHTAFMAARIEITDINHNGQGVGKDDTGLVHFVAGALPGETVLCRTRKKTKTYVTAEIVSIEIASPNRVVPRCPVAGRCGGCNLQHFAYEAELAWKEKRVRSTLEHIGKIDLTSVTLLPIKRMDDPWAYRNKAAYPIGGKTPEMGFYAARSHDIIPHDICPVLPDGINEVKKITQALMLRDRIEPYDEANHTGTLKHVVVRQAGPELMLTFVLCEPSDTVMNWPEEIAAALKQSGSETLASAYTMVNPKRSNVILEGVLTHVYGTETITETLNGLDFSLRPDAFFQINTAQAERLFNVVTEWAKEASNTANILDLYCGSGAIALHLAETGRTITGVDIVEPAIREARQNAKQNNISRVSFSAADAVQYVREHGANDAQLVVVDPPRKGLDEALMNVLIEASSIETMIYVSCNPATLARDLAYMSDSFRPVRIQPVDMFPHTTHVETICLMSSVKA